MPGYFRGYHYLQGLGQWVNQMHQPFLIHAFIIKDFELKHLLDNLTFPQMQSYAQLMLPLCVLTLKQICIWDHISPPLRKWKGTNLSLPVWHFNRAQDMVFNNSTGIFGDWFWKQISGTRIGVFQALPWTNIFFGLHEVYTLSMFPNKSYVSNNSLLMSYWCGNQHHLPLWMKLSSLHFDNECKNIYDLECTFTEY